MPRPGYREGLDRVLWWRAAMHLDEARLAVVNALAHGLDDPTSGLALQDKLRDAQAILLEIFRARGLLPSGTSGGAEVPRHPADFVPMTEGVAPATPAAEVVAAEAPSGRAPVSAAEEAAAYEDAVEDPRPSIGVVAAPGGAASPGAPSEEERRA
jgi:hypothetical protein